MSGKSKEERSEERKGRVNVGELPGKEEALENAEARDVKGGGGAAGGVIGSKTGRNIGEEIPS
jgi:hypothetical protein